MPEIRTSGPVFDGRAGVALKRFRAEVVKEIAQEGAKQVRQTLHTVLRHPTGYYESQVRAERQGDEWSVNDSGVVYGPWLEGTGSRNAPVTRFKGYKTFDRVKGRLNRRTEAIGERVLQRYLRDMN